MNEYTEIADYYDLLMENGYYDYPAIAQAFDDALGGRRKVLELGTGTGLLLEHLLKINSNYELTGIDHTESMLKIARKRLADRARLIEANLVSMELGEIFDAVICNGVWAMIDRGDEYHLGTHIPDDADNFTALQNIAKHLPENGLFLMNIQGKFDPYDFPLPGGIVYGQEVSPIEEKSDQYSIYRSYVFKKEDQILAKQTLTYKFYKNPGGEKIMADAGFKLQGIHPSKRLYCYARI
jgi:SAM-dependent methyltransferase